MIKTIFLDLDGPILEGKCRHYQCYNDILIENGFVPLEIEAYWAMKRNRIDRRQQLAASQADGIYEQFLQSWLKRIEKKDYLALDQLQPGVLERLQQWRSLGIELTLVTMRNHEDNLHWQLDELGLSPLLDRVLAVGTASGEMGKAEAARPYVDGGAAGTALWIGDTEIDISAARSLGVRVCAVCCGLRTSEYLASLTPDFLCPDLRALNLSEM